MNNFSLINKIRNKIRIKGQNEISLKDRKSLKLVKSKIIIKGNNNKLIIGKNVIIRNSIIEIVGENNTLSIDDNTMIGGNCYLSVKEKFSKLIIGKNCGLSRNTKIMTSDGHYIYQNNSRINPAKDIYIEDNVWIADNVTILKGVTIKCNSVIGINSTVTKDVEQNSIVAGNPAKEIKKDITWKP